MKKLVCAAMAALSSSAFAGDLSFTSITCGDHWFSVSAKIDAETMKGQVTFSGDGVSDDAVHAATVSDDGDVIIALDGRDDALIVDDFDAMHNLFWGSYKQGDQVIGLGLCSAQ